MPEQGTLKSEVSGESPIYSGGACVKFSGRVDEQAYCLTTLYEADAAIDKPFDVNYTVRSNADSSLSLLLKMSTTNGLMYILLESQEQPSEEVHNTTASSILFLRPRNTVQCSQGWILYEHTVEDTGKLEEILAVSYSYKQRALTISNIFKDFASKDHSLISRGDKALEKSSSFLLYEACLGHVAINVTHEHMFNKKEAFEQPFESSDVVWEELSGKRVVSLTLTWRLRALFSCEIMNYGIFVHKGTIDGNFEHLGVAMVGAFYVSQLEVPEVCKLLTFCLQISCNCGFSGTLDSSPIKEILVA